MPSGAELGFQALQNRQGQYENGAIDLDKIFKSYEEMKKLDQDQKRLDEEKAYHQGYLNLQASTAGYRPKAGVAGQAANPYAFEPDPDQLQAKQTQAMAGLLKDQADLSSKGPNWMQQILAKYGVGTYPEQLSTYQNALAANRLAISKFPGMQGGMGAPDGALPETGLPPELPQAPTGAVDAFASLTSNHALPAMARGYNAATTILHPWLTQRAAPSSSGSKKVGKYTRVG